MISATDQTMSSSEQILSVRGVSSFEDQQLDTAFGDKNRWKHIVTQLSLNAIKNTQQGGIIKTKINYDSLKKQICFLIQDNGEGIDHDKKLEITKMLDDDKNEFGPETYNDFPGLNICKEIVSKFNGKIKLIS